MIKIKKAITSISNYNFIFWEYIKVKIKTIAVDRSLIHPLRELAYTVLEGNTFRGFQNSSSFVRLCWLVFNRVCSDIHIQGRI